MGGIPLLQNQCDKRKINSGSRESKIVENKLKHKIEQKILHHSRRGGGEIGSYQQLMLQSSKEEHFQEELSEDIQIEKSNSHLEGEISEHFQAVDGEVGSEKYQNGNINKNEEGEVEQAVDFLDTKEFELGPPASTARLRRGGIPLLQGQSCCQFCQWQLGKIQFLRKNMHLRYFDAFNFYFAKPINEILANYQLPHVISLKDYQYLDEDNEYLKRYYAVNEVPPRLAVLTNYFANSYHQTRPNLIVTSQHKTIEKRNIKQARIFVIKLKKQGKGPMRGFPRLFNRNNDSSESEEISESEEKQSELKQGQKDQGILKKKKVNVPSKVLYSHLSQTIQLSQTKSQQCEQTGNLNNLSAEYENYRNFILQMSFESSAHDIYNPNFSKSVINSSKINEFKSKQENSLKQIKEYDPTLEQFISKDNNKLIDLLIANSPSGNFDTIIEQMTLKGQQQRYHDLIDSVAAIKNITPKSILPNQTSFNPNVYIMGEQNGSSGQDSAVESAPSSSDFPERSKQANGSRFFSSYSELNNPIINVEINSNKNSNNNRSTNILPYSNSNSNNTNNNNINKSGGNGFKNIQDSNNSKGMSLRSSLPTTDTNNNLNTSRSNSESKRKDSKSIQQVQQYILSQIKKQHEVLNSNQSQPINPQNQQTHIRASVSPTSPRSRQQQQQKQNKMETRKPSAGKKQLTERNYTETNLGSVFEKLRLSIRMASLENKQLTLTEPNLQSQNINSNYININQFNQNNDNNYDGYLQKLTGESLPRRDSASKKQKQMVNPIQAVGSLNTSPPGFTPRDFSKKSSTARTLITTDSAPHLTTEQSPIKNGNFTRKIPSFPAENKKGSNLSKRQLVPSKSRESGNHASQDGSISPTHFPFKQPVIPKSMHVVSTTPTIHQPNQGQFQVPISTNGISPISTNLNPTLSFSQKIACLNQKLAISQANNQGRIKTQDNLDSKFNNLNYDRDFKSARVKTSMSPPPASQKQKNNIAKRGSQGRISSPSSLNSQNVKPNLIPSSYFQHQGQLLLQQQNQGSISSSLHLLQHTAGNPHEPSQSLLFSQQTPMNQQILMSQQQQQSGSNNMKVDKQLTERILTNALTNTINKFYKNIVKKTDAPETNIKQNQYHNQANPSSQIQQTPGFLLGNPKTLPSESDLSPMLKLGARKTGHITKELESLPLRATHSQKESIGSAAAAFQQEMVDQITGKTNHQMIYAGILPSHAPLNKKKQQQLQSRQKTNNSHNETGGSLLGIATNQSINSSMNNNNNANPQQFNNNGMNVNGNGNSNFQGSVGGSNNLNNNINININNNFNAPTITTNHTTFNYNHQNEFLQNQLSTAYVQPITNDNYGQQQQQLSLQQQQQQFTHSKTNFFTNTKSSSQHLPINQEQVSIPIPPIKLQQSQSQQIPSKQQQSGEFSQNPQINFPNHNRVESQKSIGTPRQPKQQLQSQQQQSSQQQQQQQSLQHQQQQYQQKIMNPHQFSQQQQQASTSSKQLTRIQQPNSRDFRAVKTETNEDSSQVYNSIVPQMKNFGMHGKNGSMHSLNQNTNNGQPHANYQAYVQNYVHSQPNIPTGYGTHQEILPQEQDYKILNQQQKKKGSSNNITPLKTNETNKGRPSRKKDDFIVPPNVPAISLFPSALEKKQNDEFQLGSGFLSQRNPSSNKKKSTEISQPHPKFISSNRGSYQGHYSDINSLKPANLNQFTQQNLPPKTISPMRQQQQQIQFNHHQNYQQPMQPTNQISAQSQYMNQLQQSQSQTSLIPTQQSVNGSGYLASGSVQNAMSQQQVAGLLNHKIKQLSQKMQQ